MSASCCWAPIRARVCCWYAATASPSRWSQARPSTAWLPPTHVTSTSSPRPPRSQHQRHEGRTTARIRMCHWGLSWQHVAPARCGLQMEMELVMPRNAARRIDTETLKRERPLVDVVASYGITLKRESSDTYRALCPFHQERTASFWIDARGEASEHHYFCFGCSSHGDVVTFVMERDGCSFVDACERLSTSGRPRVVEPVQRIPTEKPPGRRWEQLTTDSAEARVLELAVELYEKELWENARAQAYLRRRTVSEEVARRQRLGYANGRSLLNRLANGRSSAELLPVAVQLGLVLERPAAEDARPAHR